MAAAYDMLGSVDCNTGDQSLGWDTDQFLMDEKKATAVMNVVVKMGGWATGGLNFDCKVRRESSDLEDLFISHIGSIDCFAKGLRNAAYMHEKGNIGKMVSQRYSSWKTLPIGVKAAAGKSTFQEMDDFARQLSESVISTSAKQELFEMVFNDEMYRATRQ